MWMVEDLQFTLNKSTQRRLSLPSCIHLQSGAASKSTSGPVPTLKSNLATGKLKKLKLNQTAIALSQALILLRLSQPTATQSSGYS